MDNTELRQLIRDLAKKRDSHERTKLYWALTNAELLMPVRVDAVEGEVNPGDLHPLNREALGGLASFAVFTHLSAAEAWQSADAEGVPLRLERISFENALNLMLAAGVGSMFINPEAKFTGELYRHELETCRDGIQKLQARQARHEAMSQEEEVVPEVSWFQKFMARFQ
jgi:hypothetical protein